MNDVEARVRCLELAANLHKPLGEYSPTAVAETAQKLYDFANNVLPAQETKPVADKSKRTTKAATPDIMS